jgi:signal transduction histidine kinase
MLDEFIEFNRAAIIASAAARVAARTCPEPNDVELTNGIPVFLQQLGHALALARGSDLIDHEQIERSASKHGHDLLRMGLTIGQVVHDYGDVCQSITELATQQGASVSADEFRTLNLCLDDAIAGAVSEYAHQRELEVARQATHKLGVLAHEMRNALNTAVLAFASIQSGRVAAGGSTALVLGRGLRTLGDLIDRSLAEVRLSVGVERSELMPVRGLMEELEIAAFIQAQAKGLHFAARAVASDVMVRGDRHILLAALSNLLDNAFKFTGKHTRISLTAVVTPDRVLFEVEDECGGLPEGAASTMFEPYQQRGVDRSGLGLGLSICARAAEAHGGSIHVRDVPGKGCVFTLELPRALERTAHAESRQ